MRDRAQGRALGRAPAWAWRRLTRLAGVAGGRLRLGDSDLGGLRATLTIDGRGRAADGDDAA